VRHGCIRASHSKCYREQITAPCPLHTLNAIESRSQPTTLLLSSHPEIDNMGSRFRGNDGPARTRYRPSGLNTSTASVKVRVSDATNAPTPTICRATSSPRSLRIDTTMEYSHT